MEDPTGVAAGTGREPDALSGGWAGGETGLWKFRSELGEPVRGPPTLETRNPAPRGQTRAPAGLAARR